MAELEYRREYHDAAQEYEYSICGILVYGVKQFLSHLWISWLEVARAHALLTRIWKATLPRQDETRSISHKADIIVHDKSMTKSKRAVQILPCFELSYQTKLD